MSFRNPFEAVPIEVGELYREGRVAEQRARLLKLGLFGLLGGIGLGYAAISLRNGDFSWLRDAGPERTTSQQDLAEPGVSSQPAAQLIFDGQVRTRAPQRGDYWRGCYSARAVGTAPILRGEAGYREGLDADGDGIACEPLPTVF